MSAEPGLPRYSVAELNQAIGSLLERGFAPRFLLDATVSRPQLKKGHLWLTLVDGDASISAVVWASQLSKLNHQPQEGDGVVVVGKLNFWASRASLSVQVLDLRPSLSSVLRRFEQVLRIGLHRAVRPGELRGIRMQFRRISAAQAVECAAARDGQEPGQCTAARRIEPQCFAPYLPVHFFADVFGEFRIACDAQRNAVYA